MAQRNGAKLNNNLPQLQVLQLKMSEARERDDKMDGKIMNNNMDKPYN